MLKKALKIITAFLYAILIIFALFKARNMTPQDIIEYSPSNIYLAALFILMLFALKSISVFFPIIILQMASGFLFPAPVALIINLTGTAIGFILPYYLGMLVGADSAEKRIKKNETLSRIIKRQRSHEFFLTFFLRVISVLPSDAVSMYLGVLRFDFRKYLASSMLGALPGIIPATFMGKSITEPFSPVFIGSLLITVVCSMISIIAYWIISKKHSKRGINDE